MIFHEEADALLPQSEEGEAHEKVDAFGETFIGKQVISGAPREEYLAPCIVSLLNGSANIEAERLILRIRVDKAFRVVAWIDVHILNFLMSQTAKRSANKIRGFLVH